MSEGTFEIGAPGVDVSRVVDYVRETVRDKLRSGVYNDGRIARAEQTNLSNLKNEDEFLRFYLECLREAVYVDINDFEIMERRPRFGRLLVAFKKCVWKSLKFYTYRLWSQQNQVNGLLLAAIEGMDESHTGKLRDLEKRIERLER